MSDIKHDTPLEGFGRILINGMSGASARIAMMLVGFTLTPFILFSLGFTDFGLLAIFGSLAGYMGLLDFGLGGIFVKFITEYSEKNDLVAARQVVTFGVLFYIAFALVMIVPVFALAPLIVHLFKMPDIEIAHAVLVFREFVSLIMATMILSIPGAVIVAKHRMDLASRNNFAGYLVYVVLTVVLLRLHFGINGLVLAQLGQVIATAALHYVTARGLFGPLFADPRSFDRAIVRRMFAFGGWTQLTALLNVAIIDAGRFLSAGLVSVASVTYYEMGMKLSYISRTIPNYLVDAVSPAAAAADAHQDRAKLYRLELTSSLYLLLVTTLLAGFIVGACEPIMRVWLGTSYPYVFAITLWLSIGYVISSSGTIGVTMLRSIGRPELEAACVGVGAVANLIASVILIRAFGIVGAGMGTCVGWLAFAIFYTVLVRKRLALPNALAHFGSALRIMAVGTACTMGLLLLVRTSWMQTLFTGKISGLAGLSICGIFYVAAFALLAWAAGAFRFDEVRIGRALMKVRTLFAARVGRMHA